MKYVAMRMRRWDSFEPAKDCYLPVPVSIDARPSVGFLPVYDTLADLYQDCGDDCPYCEIQEARDGSK
jgi:hypothetical protein